MTTTNNPHDMTIPQLVRELVELKVWFAVNEVAGPVSAGAVRHQCLRAVVTELRARGVLD